MSEREKRDRIIDRELWRIAGFLGHEVMDDMDIGTVAAFVLDILSDFGHIEITYAHVCCRIKQIRKYRMSLSKLMEIPQVAQRSPEWYDMRRNRLTASDIAQAIDQGHFGSRKQLVVKKAFPENDTFKGNRATEWGVMFEPMVARCYSQRNHDMVLHEFGLIPHPTISHLGASPDNISDLGIMVEYKAPISRKVTGEIPHHYFLQMQAQMETANIPECDFVDAKMQCFTWAEQYFHEVGPFLQKDHGIILKDVPGELERFIYSPAKLTSKETYEWMKTYLKKLPQEISKEVKPIFWKVNVISVKRVYFDKELWETLKVGVDNFWTDVEEMRKKGPATNKPNTLDLDIGSSADEAEKTKRPKKQLDFIEDEEDP